MTQPLPHGSRPLASPADIVRTAWPEGTRRHLAAAVHRSPSARTARWRERAFTAVFSRLVYAQIWEDPVVDLQALSLGRNERLFTISSGGCNVLSYLSAQPAEIVAVDLNAHHLALLRLRLAAVRHLPDHEHLYRLFGEADHAGNRSLYGRWLGHRLPPADRRYWSARDARLRPRIAMLERNLYRHGVLGRFIGLAHLMARMHGVDLSGLARQQDLAGQREFFDRHVGPLFDKAALRLLAGREPMLFGLGIPPAQAELLAADAGGDILQVLHQRLRRLACDFPIRRNYFAMQAFTRSYRGCEPDHLPLYLQARHFEAVRAGAGRVEIAHQSMTDRLRAEPQASVDAVVLLDAQDWMTRAQRDALWREITRTARPGARVIFRTAGRDGRLEGEIDAAVSARWRYDGEASRIGLAADRSAIYGGFHLFRLQS